VVSNWGYSCLAMLVLFGLLWRHRKNGFVVQTSLPQEINTHARTHKHTIVLYLQHEIIRQFSRNYIKSYFHKLNYIYKDSYTSSLSTTTITPFGISLTHGEQNKTTKLLLHSVLPHVHNRYSTVYTNNVSSPDFPTEQRNVCISTICG